MTDTTQNSSSTNLNVADSHGTHTKEWDLYNKEKTLLLNFFTKAESTLQSSSELVQDEVEAQEVCKELHSTLKELKDLLKSMTECNTKLRKKIRRPRKREQLDQEMRDFSQLFDTVENQLTERLDFFQGSVVRWRECYKRLHVLCDWMLDTEAKLTRTENTTLKTTEKHVTEAKAFYNQIYEKGVTLEAIEADVKTLTTNTSSQQEHSPLTSNIALVRRKWESLCSRSLAQSENLAHWQSYRKLKKQVVLWVVRTEKQCGGELAECTSPEQAETLCALCQKLLQEHEENRKVLETLRREAAYFGDLPNVIDELEIMHNRWNSIGTTLRHRLEDLQKPFVASSSSSNKASSNSEVTNTQTSGEGNISDSAAVSDRLNASQEFSLIEQTQDSASDVQSSHNGEQTHPEEETGTTVSTDGAGRAENQQKSVRAIFAEMTSNAARKEQTRTVSLPERRQTLLSRLKPVEERAKRMQQCIIESSHEIYPADMPNRIKTLQGMLAEYNQHTPATDALQQDLGDLMNTSSDEDHKSLDPHVKVLQRLDKIGDMLEARVSVCEKWEQYDSALKGLQAELESLQKRLNNASGIAAEEATEVTSEVPRLRGALISKQKEAEGLTERMKATQVFLKDPVTHNPLHLQTQLQELEQMCDAVELTTQTKPYSHERQNSDGTGPTNTRLSDSGGPVYKVRLSQPDLQNQERKEHHTTSSEARTSASSGSEVNIGHANTVAITSTDITEEGEPNAIPSSQTEETPSDTNPSSPSDDISTAGMAVNVGYADTVTISMSNARARFDWSDTARDSREERARERQHIQEIHDNIARLSHKIDTAMTRTQSDATLISQIEEMVEKRKREEEHLSKMTERENVVIYYLQPDEKHSVALRQSPKVLKDDLLMNLAQDLYRHFSIRLLTISQDFVLFMDVPCAEAPNLKRNLPVILSMIRNVLHEKFSHTMTWQPPGVCSPWDIWKMAKQQRKAEEQAQNSKERKSEERNLEDTIAQLGSLLENERLQAAEKEAQIHEYQAKLDDNTECTFSLDRLSSLLEKEKQNTASKDAVIQELQNKLEDIKGLQTDLDKEKRNAADKDCIIHELQHRMSLDASRLRQERDEERERRNKETDSFVQLVKDLSEKCFKLGQQQVDEIAKSQETERKLEREQARHTELETRLQQGPAGLNSLFAENENLKAELQVLKDSVKSATLKIEHMRR